ncbi:MAG: hypothetical protein AAF202_06625 [Pseudomonadota bacterium]
MTTLMIANSLTALVLILGFALSAYAGDKVDKRQKAQAARTLHGAKDLDNKERAVLRRGRRRIRRAERNAEAETNPALKEKKEKRVNRMQNRQSRRIYRGKHN